MKKLSIIWLFIFFLSFLSTQCFAYVADEHFIFRTDFLEPENPGGWTHSLKTFDEEYSVTIGSTIEVDIWTYNFPLPGMGLLVGDIVIFYDPAQLSILSVDVYDGVHGPAGPWDPGFGYQIPDYNGPGSYLFTLGNFNCVFPDSDGDVITAKVRFLSVGCGDTVITVGQPHNHLDPTFYGCPLREYVGDHYPITIHQIDPTDNDCDGIINIEDNCPLHYNPNQEDDLPSPDGNGIPDACDCEGNFACDGDCDGTDAGQFKLDFGRSAFDYPCINESQCHGDFDCDGDVDGTDAALFKRDFGRSGFNNPCPSCIQGDWCMYP